MTDRLKELPRRDVPALVEALRVRALALTGQEWERTATADMMKEAADALEAPAHIREELDELRAWRINVTSALRREGGALYADVPEHVRELRRQQDRVTMLCKAVHTVIEGFDKGIFVRDVTGDTDTWWAVRLLPYVSALATMKELVEI